MESNLLSLLVWLPVIGLAAIALMPRDKTKEIKLIAALATGVQLVMALVLWAKFDPAIAGMQFVERAEWIP